MFETLKEFICDFANIPTENITEQMNIRNDFSLDSISLLNLAVAIEDEFGVEITIEDMNNIETVGDFLEFIENNK